MFPQGLLSYYSWISVAGKQLNGTRPRSSTPILEHRFRDPYESVRHLYEAQSHLRYGDIPTIRRIGDLPAEPI